MTLITLFERLLFVAKAASRADPIDGVSPGRALAFRGWTSEIDEVVRSLKAAGIATEVVETVVPAIIGGALVVCEAYVQVADLAPALRTVAPIVSRHKAT